MVATGIQGLEARDAEHTTEHQCPQTRITQAQMPFFELTGSALYTLDLLCRMALREDRPLVRGPFGKLPPSAGRNRKGCITVAFIYLPDI